MAYATDNRWICGQAPDTAVAAYGARWIDQGDYMRFDIVPDRQGFAYHDASDRERLIDHLNDSGLRDMNETLDRSDEWQHVIDHSPFHVHMRRTGGYVYCEAWLT